AGAAVRGEGGGERRLRRLARRALRAAAAVRGRGRARRRRGRAGGPVAGRAAGVAGRVPVRAGLRVRLGGGCGPVGGPGRWVVADAVRAGRVAVGLVPVGPVAVACVPVGSVAVGSGSLGVSPGARPGRRGVPGGEGSRAAAVTFAVAAGVTAAVVTRLLVSVGAGRACRRGLVTARGARSRGIAARRGDSSAVRTVGRGGSLVAGRVWLRLGLVAIGLRVARLLPVGGRVAVGLGRLRPVRAGRLPRVGRGGRGRRNARRLLPGAVVRQRRRQRGDPAAVGLVPLRGRGLARAGGVRPGLRGGRLLRRGEALLGACLCGRRVLLVLLAVAVVLVLRLPRRRGSGALLARRTVAAVAEGTGGELRASRRLLGPAGYRVALVVVGVLVVTGLLIRLRLAVTLAAVGLVVRVRRGRRGLLRPGLVRLGVERLCSEGLRAGLAVRRLVRVPHGRPRPGFVAVRRLGRTAGALEREPRARLPAAGLRAVGLRPGLAVAVGRARRRLEVVSGLRPGGVRGRGLARLRRVLGRRAEAAGLPGTRLPAWPGEAGVGVG